MVGGDVGAALIAAPEVSAERFRAASQDVGDGAPVRGQHHRAMRQQVTLREAAEDVRDLDHSRCAASESAVAYVFQSLKRLCASYVLPYHASATSKGRLLSYGLSESSNCHCHCFRWR